MPERIAADKNIMPDMRPQLVVRAAEIVSSLVPHWLPEQPLAPHGDHLPTALQEVEE